MTRQRLLDAAVAFGLLGLGLGVYFGNGSPPGDRAPDVFGALLVFGTYLPLLWRRQYPIPVLFIAAATTIPYWALDYIDDVSGLSVVVALYSTTAFTEDRRRAWLAAGLALLAALAIGISGVISSDEDIGISDVVGFMTFFTVGAAIGDMVRHRRLYREQLEERAAQAERDREERTRQAVNDERRRIARELHDVVAHSMSVMVVHAGAARRVIDVDPEQAKQAVVNIEETGRESLTDMRRILGILRGEDTDERLAPQPRLGEFETLVKNCEEAGLPVDVDVVGTPRPLPAGVELTAYRIVQEALTNAVKHAGPAEARVSLRYEPDTLEIEVSDNGRGATTHTNGSGHGLVGMRERVELYGGELVAGPAKGGGYRVKARLST